MNKNTYITTAIPYVNGTPHIGNALDYLLADIWTRYQKQNGHNVRFQIGTDEHGNKNAMKAAELGLTPQDYVDQAHLPFKAMAEKVGASYTDLIRTSDMHHKAAVQYIWNLLKPHIYKDRYEGWYCTGCEQFYTDKEVAETEGLCPNHKKEYEHLSEENYYLRASDFTDRIRQAIESNEMEIVPEFRKNEILALIKDGVKDVSVSRPRKSLSWGVPVPDDPEHVIYVWIDALSSYITALGYPDKPDWQDYWPANVQVIGKDILRFHAITWPAILLGIGAPLPQKILAHGFINIGGGKISKTVGNIVSPDEIIDTYGLDAFRYFFSMHIPTQEDGDFTWEKFEKAYNGELANDLGNLVFRVGNMINRYQAGVIGDAPQGEHDMQEYHEAMKNLEFNKAIDSVWATVRSLNKYIDDVKPWMLAKNKDTDQDAEGHLSEVLSHCVGNLLQIGDLLVPFMPNTANAIHNTFESGIVKLPEGVLFPKIHLHTEANLAKKTNVS
ncbi:methionine--tRNA ligase [Candidatus Saccharibacteria bacterium]|nr:methionine--tRNA ligase [Candidatus Saccharibacteria bacterium]